ncbi:MAG: hypothetical protein NPIRA04_15720 [Nitrospirales bacterium]|nr:MAG: hypothetical protein NPIRA04_15720 [Nitrospirales bacterium]
MKKSQNICLGASMILCTTMWTAVAFANPGLLPDHPGYPMNAAESPVTGKSLANDPGRSQLYEQEALRSSSKDANSEAAKGKNGKDQSMNDMTPDSSEQPKNQ